MRRKNEKMENEKDLTNQNELEKNVASTTPKPHRQRIPYGERVTTSQRSFEPRDNFRGRHYSYNNDNNGYRQSTQKPNYSYRSRIQGDENNVMADGQESLDNFRESENGFTPRPRFKTPGQRSFGERSSFSRNTNGFQRNGFQKRGFSHGGFRNSNGASFKGAERRKYSSNQHTADYDPSAKYNVQKVLRYKEANIDLSAPIRLNRFLSNAGVCSRREADQYITNGQVSVNGEVITELGHKILRTDNVCFNGKPVSIEDKVYVLLNKPKDYVTTSDDPEGRKTVMDLVKGACPERIYPVGRLDRNTTGVLLLTNDGEMAAKMMHPKFMKKKIYHVYCNKPVSFADMQKILQGVILEDGEIHADRIEYASEADRKQIGIEIHSGKNRIVRRIFENLGYKVVKLDRVYFAGLTKKNLRRGHWRFLEEAEVNMLRMGAYE